MFKKILVTGGAGFIGSHIVDKLISQNNKVVIIDNLSTGQKENINKKARFYKADITNKKIKEIFKKEKPDIVFHLAAQINVRKSIQNPLLDTKVNVLGSLNIFQAAKESNVKKIIFSSTGGAIYGKAKKTPTPETCQPKPQSPYGLSKLTTENYLKLYHKLFNINYTILRYSNVYGPRQNTLAEAGVIAIFTKQLLKSKTPVINGTGKQERDYVYVKDVVSANLSSLKRGDNKTFNIGTSKKTSVNQIFKTLSQKINPQIKAKHGPSIKGEIKTSALNIRKAKNNLNWKPKTNLKTGIEKTINWFKKEIKKANNS